MIKRQRPHVVTGAAISRHDEHKARQRRYMVTMTARVVLLVIAAIVARYNVALGIGIGVLSALLPGFAVVMANDRPPKKRAARPAGVGSPREAALASGASPGAAETDRRIITAGAVIIDENGATMRPTNEE